VGYGEGREVSSAGLDSGWRRWDRWEEGKRRDLALDRGGMIWDGRLGSSRGVQASRKRSCPGNIFGLVQSAFSAFSDTTKLKTSSQTPLWYTQAIGSNAMPQTPYTNYSNVRNLPAVSLMPNP